ncbi:hypothetical protein BC351_10535 [Paenibacillus ferrarius]|uniref:Uncharacterized protein n=1 Tax=Paenibacillus ferrarius TaxID=1469647 RepID=A0A1V4H8X4_9BACL|nr:hypothetical protein [Paenibacillus ferrarius]OPH47618.1 hypothetical protein BC351_10535 [Paenibacillus ferrarius]
MRNSKNDTHTSDKSVEALESVTKSQAEIEVEELKVQLAEMQKLIESMASNQDQNTSKTKDTDGIFVSDIQDPIPSNKLIQIISMVSGGLNLEANGKKINIPDFGNTIQITFEDLRAAYNHTPKIIDDGWLLIQSEEAVKYMYLEEKYKKFVSKKFIENIINLPKDQIVETLKGLGTVAQKTSIDLIIKGLADKDDKYSDMNKLHVISEFIGQDINELAKNR